MHVEFGSCASLYGCVGMLADECLASLKMRCTKALVPSGATSLRLADLVIVDTVQTLLVCKPYITSQMIVIVCDSPANIALLKHVTPFDYEGDIFSEFKLKAPPKSLPLKLNHPIPIESSRADLVKEAVASIATATLLTDYNTLISKMNSHARNMLRFKMCELFLNRETVDGVAMFLQSLTIDGDEFINKLRSKYFTALRNAVIYHEKGHTIEYVTSKFGVTETYEVTYFMRMLKQHKEQTQR